MRKKMKPDEKRSKIIGIKVKPEIFQKLDYIATRELTTISSYINDILTKKVEEYFDIAKIDWENLSPEEKEVNNVRSDSTND